MSTHHSSPSLSAPVVPGGLLVVGIVVGGFLLLRRHIHPLVALLWVGLAAVVLAPVFAVALAATVTVRTHRSWRSWRRTLAMAVSWAVAFALIAAVIELAWPELLLVVIPTGAIAWAIDHHTRTRRALRFVPSPPPPFD
jgi:hypothetical protein